MEKNRSGNYFLNEHPLVLAKRGILSMLKPEPGNHRPRLDFTLLDTVNPQIDGEKSWISAT